MKLRAFGFLLFGAAAFLRPMEGLCQSMDWRGQLSAWFTTNDSQTLRTQLGIRYIPVFSLKKKLGWEIRVRC